MDMILRLHRAGQTVALITHDMKLVLRYACTVAVMSEGQILFQGSPDRLFLCESLVEQAGLSLPFEMQLGQRLGDPLIFLQPDWTARFQAAASDSPPGLHP
jgi:ABC-type multidrug transport system ATPase subunit